MITSNTLICNESLCILHDYTCLHLLKKKIMNCYKHIRTCIDLYPPEFNKMHKKHVHYENECYLGKKYANEDNLKGEDTRYNKHA